MSSQKEKPATQKDLEELGKAWGEKFLEHQQTVEAKIGELSSSSKTGNSSKNEGESELPKYKCRGKGCSFETEDIADFIDHTLDEKLQKQQGETPPKQEEPAKKRHETVEEYLDCPECGPRFEKGLRERGWVKKEEAEAEKESSLL